MTKSSATIELDDAGASLHQSAATRRLIREAEAIAQTSSSVLISGETGAGKDVLARYIHLHSSRASKSIIAINCGALPDTLFESELFGHEKGSFTGATMLRQGLLEAADESTLFLDEIGDMPLAM